MTKQFAIQVQLADQSKTLIDEKKLMKMLQDYAHVLFQSATTGPIPAVTVFECVDAKDENLADFAKDVEVHGA